MPMVAVKQPYVLFLVNDTSPHNPRTEQDNFGKMICFHRRYDIGDEHKFNDPDEFLVDLLEEKLGDTDAAEDKFAELSSEVDDTLYKSQYGQYRKAIHEKILQFLSNSYVIEPIFMYDHSGITINTKGFACPWDSGQVGWIFASHDTIKNEFGQINDETIESAKVLLKSEVKEYDYYLTDQCYGFRLYKSNEEIASCWKSDRYKESVWQRIAIKAIYRTAINLMLKIGILVRLNKEQASNHLTEIQSNCLMLVLY